MSEWKKELTKIAKLLGEKSNGKESDVEFAAYLVTAGRGQLDRLVDLIFNAQKIETQLRARDRFEALADGFKSIAFDHEGARHESMGVSNYSSGRESSTESRSESVGFGTSTTTIAGSDEDNV